MDILTENRGRLNYWLKVALVAFLIAFVVSGFSDGDSGDRDSEPEHTISFTGHGEVNAVPDIATVYFTINKDAKTVKEAQQLVAEVEKKTLDFIKQSGVEEKDIKATDASFSPKYEYKYDSVRTMMPCTPYNCPPQPGKSVIVGYTASESITVKIRNTDDAGKIIEGLGALGVTNLSGPNFAIDKEDELKAEARRKAIADAKTKAKSLAKDLGVGLGDIVSFSESGNYMPYYGKMMMGASEDSAATPAPAQLPKGENTISSDVTITYEID